jgi:hypothetical protein
MLPPTILAHSPHRRAAIAVQRVDQAARRHRRRRAAPTAWSSLAGSKTRRHRPAYADPGFFLGGMAVKVEPDVAAAAFFLSAFGFLCSRLLRF